MISLGGSIPAFMSKFAFADEVAGTKISGDNILVVIQLSGGNDGLNTVIPRGNDAYLKARASRQRNESGGLNFITLCRFGVPLDG